MLAHVPDWSLLLQRYKRKRNKNLPKQNGGGFQPYLARDSWPVRDWTIQSVTSVAVKPQLFATTAIACSQELLERCLRRRWRISKTFHWIAYWTTRHLGMWPSRRIIRGTPWNHAAVYSNTWEFGSTRHISCMRCCCSGNISRKGQERIVDCISICTPASTSRGYKNAARPDAMRSFKIVSSTEQILVTLHCWKASIIHSNGSILIWQHCLLLF